MIDSAEFLEMMISGKENLKKHVDELNVMNELPMPDHDTGTNMFYTMKFGLAFSSAYDLGIDALNISIRTSMGAKGKSGEILARFFDGFVKPLEHKTYFNDVLLLKSFQNAYASLSIYHITHANCIPHVMGIMDKMVDAAERLVRRTPLENIIHCMVYDAQEHVKKNNITDAGCIGLLYIIEGMSMYLNKL